MSKERLNLIKTRYSGIRILDCINGIDIIAVDREDVDWLIEQAERIRKLKQQFSLLHKLYDVAVSEIAELHEQGNRYREALEFYADYDANWHDDGINEIVPGERARKALEVEDKWLIAYLLQ